MNLTESHETASAPPIVATPVHGVASYCSPGDLNQQTAVVIMLRSARIARSLPFWLKMLKD